MRIEVVGVYPVAAAERCHLIELLIAEAEPAADAVESITLRSWFRAIPARVPEFMPWPRPALDFEPRIAGRLE